MTKPKAKVKAMVIRNASIRNTKLGFQNGLATSDIYFTLDQSAIPGDKCAMGGVLLWKHKDENPADLTGTWVFRVLKVVGVDSWEALIGTPCRIKTNGRTITAIAHYLNDEWFDVSEIVQ